MKNRLISDIREWFSSLHKVVRNRSQNGFADVYVTHLAKELNYCKLHPNASRCR